MRKFWSFLLENEIVKEYEMFERCFLIATPPLALDVGQGGRYQGNQNILENSRCYIFKCYSEFFEGYLEGKSISFVIGKNSVVTTTIWAFWIGIELGYKATTFLISNFVKYSRKLI